MTTIYLWLSTLRQAVWVWSRINWDASVLNIVVFSGGITIMFKHTETVRAEKLKQHALTGESSKTMPVSNWHSRALHPHHGLGMRSALSRRAGAECGHSGTPWHQIQSGLQIWEWELLGNAGWRFQGWCIQNGDTFAFDCRHLGVFIIITRKLPFFALGEYAAEAALACWWNLLERLEHFFCHWSQNCCVSSGSLLRWSRRTPTAHSSCTHSCWINLARHAWF